MQVTSNATSSGIDQTSYKLTPFVSEIKSIRHFVHSGGLFKWNLKKDETASRNVILIQKQDMKSHSVNYTVLNPFQCPICLENMKCKTHFSQHNPDCIQALTAKLGAVLLLLKSQSNTLLKNNCRNSSCKVQTMADDDKNPTDVKIQQSFAKFQNFVDNKTKVNINVVCLLSNRNQ
ncbi:hypothetical protein HDU92_003037 [Lobulomyces angularis]|nr:hypothetical protein HDU92_003037 [Lobulomyces angularis]